MGTLDIRYTFRLTAPSEDGTVEERVEVLDVCVDEESLEMQRPADEEAPAWTELDFHKCPNCPLDAKDVPHCPLALSIAGIVERFDSVMSYDEVDVEVEMRSRVVKTRASSQAALSSLMGLVFAASGCPHTRFFKPMARFHLPFASQAATAARAVGTYLTAQYFRKLDGEAADLELEGLDAIYRNLQAVNMATAQRLRAATTKDSSLNAVVRLDMYAQAVPFFIRESLARIRGPYDPYLRG